MIRTLFAFAALALVPQLRADEPDLREQAQKALKRAATFYRTKVAAHGGYVYYYSADLKQRWGEGAADADTLFVQPPGTPTVGTAYLDAFDATGDAFYRDAATDTANALVYGQLQSGGWTQTIHFGPAKRLGKYRNGKGGSWNVSSLDDGQTQAALLMLMRADKTLNFKNEAIHEAASYGLEKLLQAQFRNGGFPQVWTKAVEDFAPRKAALPDYDWKTEGRVKNYWDFPTLNDGLAGTVCDVLVAAHETSKDAKYKSAIAKLGDFLILAQMPDPQPGWCQQYTQKMEPMWARKFEPPAITGWESQDAMRTLIRVARVTGDKKYLEPVPKALAYFEKCLLPDGRVARFYELKTNKPLYMNARYELTYDDSAAPSHYGWKQPSGFKDIAREYEAAKAGKPVEVKPVTPEHFQLELKLQMMELEAKARAAKRLEADVKRIVAELDAHGRWVSAYAGERLVGQPKFADGFKYISSDVFARNVAALSAYLKAK